MARGGPEVARWKSEFTESQLIILTDPTKYFNMPVNYISHVILIETLSYTEIPIYAM